MVTVIMLLLAITIAVEHHHCYRHERVGLDSLDISWLS